MPKTTATTTTMTKKTHTTSTAQTFFSDTDAAKAKVKARASDALVKARAKAKAPAKARAKASGKEAKAKATTKATSTNPARVKAKATAEKANDETTTKLQPPTCSDKPRHLWHSKEPARAPADVRLAVHAGTFKQTAQPTRTRSQQPRRTILSAYRSRLRHQLPVQTVSPHHNFMKTRTGTKSRHHILTQSHDALAKTFSTQVELQRSTLDHQHGRRHTPSTSTLPPVSC